MWQTRLYTESYERSKVNKAQFLTRMSLYSNQANKILFICNITEYADERLKKELITYNMTSVIQTIQMRWFDKSPGREIT